MPASSVVLAGAVNVLRALLVKVAGFMRVATRLPGAPLLFSLILTLVVSPDVTVLRRIRTSVIVYSPVLSPVSNL